MNNVLKALINVISAITTNPKPSATVKTVNFETPTFPEGRLVKNGETLKVTYTLSAKEPNMEIAAILALINGLLPLIQKCREDRNPTDEELVSAARGAQGVFAIRKANRANGLRGRKFRIANREAVNQLISMSDEELLEQVINAPEFDKDEDGSDGVDYDLFA